MTKSSLHCDQIVNWHLLACSSRSGPSSCSSHLLSSGVQFNANGDLHCISFSLASHLQWTNLLNSSLGFVKCILTILIHATFHLPVKHFNSQIQFQFSLDHLLWVTTSVFTKGFSIDTRQSHSFHLAVRQIIQFNSYPIHPLMGFIIKLTAYSNLAANFSSIKSSHIYSYGAFK